MSLGLVWMRLAWVESEEKQSLGYVVKVHDDFTNSVFVVVVWTNLSVVMIMIRDVRK